MKWGKKSMNARRSRTAIRHAHAALVALVLGSCASDSGTRTDPPPAGMAVIDATPNRSRRERIDGIRIVSVNGAPANGTETELRPGRNRVRIRFKWPRDGAREADLDFHARAGTIYAIYYDVYPPIVDQPLVSDERGWGSLLGAVADTGGEGAIAAPMAAAVLLPFVAAEAAVNRTDVDDRAAEYVDLMVVARRSSEGIACYRRVFADGRIQNR